MTDPSPLRCLADPPAAPTAARADRFGHFAVSFLRARKGQADLFVPAEARHRPAARALLRGKLHEPRTHALVRALLGTRGGDIVHAGTFFGDMLPSFARACTGRVFAFEPVLENYLLAKLCVEANGLENVVLQNAALGSAFGTARIRTRDRSGRHLGGASHLSDTGQIVSVAPVDSLGLDRLSVLHLDVEGQEAAALQGAAYTIARCDPVILVEDNADRCETVLGEMGYVFAGRIPGQNVWARRADLTEIRTVLDAL